MADNQRYAQLQPFALAGAGAVAGDTSVTLKQMLDIDGNEVDMTYFGTTGFGTLEPGNGDLEEQIVFTGITQNTNGTATLTGVSNVLFAYPYTQSSGLAKTHAGSVTFVISNTSGYYDTFTNKNDNETIVGLYDFPSGSNNPTIGNLTYVAPTADTQIATKKYVDQTATGTTNVDQIVITGTGGETITNGQAVYLKTSDQRWWRADSSATASSVGVQLGFANSASTAGTSITVLIAGYEKNLLGLTPGSDYFLTDTPGSISTTPGTNKVLIGNAVSAALLLMENIPTKAQLLGNLGTPSSLNLFVTQKGFQNAAEVYAVGTSGTDAYAITLSPAPTAYAAGQTFRFKADVANTGAATLNVNGLGAKSLITPDGAALATGQIASGSVVTVTYDGTSMQIESASANNPNLDYQAFTGSGTWTKPANLTGNELVLIQAWGGGASGGGINSSTGRGGGGGGGAYTEWLTTVSSLTGTVTVTIGAVQTGVATAGVSGNNTTFGAYLTAFGGGGGASGTGNISAGGGGGGGSLGKGASVTSTTGGAGGSPGGGSAGSGESSGYGGGGGGTGGAGGFSASGGGGGGSDSNAGTGNGGTTMFGGGGGGGGDAGGATTGGASRNGGVGGAGATGNAAGSAGVAPGGGGGGAARTGSGVSLGGDGARGEVRVWVIK